MNGKEKDSGVGGEGERNGMNIRVSQNSTNPPTVYWMISEGDVLFGGRSWYHLS